MRRLFDRVGLIRSTVPQASFFVLLVLISAYTLPAQEDEGGQGVSAGGKWMQYSSEDRMTAQHRTRFELPAENLPDSDHEARIVLYCSDGKLTLADFHPGSKLAPPNWPGFWGQPQMRVRVRFDDGHDEHSWNWIRGHFLAMDKGTTRAMLGAKPHKLTGFGIAISEIRLLPARGAGFERRRFWLRQLFEELIRGRTDASATLLPFRVGAVPGRPQLWRDLVVAAALLDQRLQIRLAKFVVGNGELVGHRAASRRLRTGSVRP